MQDINSITDGRLFNVGDRRIRQHNNHNHHHQPPLKCPRCDSRNTKFCYYNNYNLSQPRHFCKGCRRYWTKGGVLRNVPLGGGSRKTKLSNKTKPSSPHPDLHVSNSHSSSSDNSNNISVVAAVADAADVVVCGDNSLNLTPEITTIKKFDQPLVDYDPSLEDGCMFVGMGTCTGMMTTGNDEFDQTTEIDQFNELHNKVSNGGLGGSYDWRGDGGDDGLFDLTRTLLDHEEYWWSQNEWHDYDKVQSVHYFP